MSLFVIDYYHFALASRAKPHWVQTNDGGN